MGIFKRISDIISANLNDLTEKFENPEKMLKQAVREMESAIDQVTQQTAKAMANEKTLARELRRNRSQCEQWQERATKAVKAGDDDLARKALARKNELSAADMENYGLGQCIRRMVMRGYFIEQYPENNRYRSDRARPGYSVRSLLGAGNGIPEQIKSLTGYDRRCPRGGYDYGHRSDADGSHGLYFLVG